MDFFSNNWILISFLAPMFWALVNIVDVYFVGGVYKNALEATIVIGLFQIIPCLAIFWFFGVDFKDFLGSGLLNVDPAVFLTLIGGIFFNLSFYFYFKALFAHVDVALLQIIWSLDVIAVPILTFLFFKEQLSTRSYLGMAIVLAGVILLSFHKNIRIKISRHYLKIMAGAMVFLSFSMILQDQAYEALNLKYSGGVQGFAVGFAGFAMGAFLASLFLAVWNKRNPARLLKKYWKWFLFLESITFLGNLASQRAISIAPSVSYVATIETFVPVFILIFSLLILFYFKFLLKKEHDYKASLIYQEQLNGAPIKILATVIMAFGVFLIS